MSEVVGVELGTGVARAVALGSWGSAPRATLVTAWDPARPQELVAFIAGRMGAPRRVALAVGLGFLHPKQVKLPPAPPAARRAMLTVEPERFFSVSERALVVSLIDEPSLAFAVSGDLLERWIRAFEAWAPVESVEAAPLALARALASAGAEGQFALTAGPDERGVVEVRGGTLRHARRVPASMPAPEAQPIPVVRGLSGDFATALGAALGVDGAVDAMLLSDARAARLRARRRRRVVLTGLVCAAAVMVALGAVDGSRERALDRIGEEIARITPRAGPALELRDRLAALDREAAALAAAGVARADPLPVLAALSERLPAGATVLSARANGPDWQIDGTARDAAALVPLLDGDARLQDVHFLSASSRFREGDRTYETFSIAFRALPAR